MFRNAILRQAGRRQTRGFVSTVLLTRNWENETVNTLKKELRRRGLLQTGGKATLVTRLQENDQQHVEPAPPQAPQQQVEHASGSAEAVKPATTETEVPGVPSTAEPNPIPSGYPKEFLNVQIPDAAQRQPEPPIQVPFVPDLWNSSKIKAESAPPKPKEPSTPKVLAVAGAATHLGGGPSHGLYPTSSTNPVTSSPNQNVWQDIAEDLYLPTSFSSHEVHEKLLEGIAETTQLSGELDGGHTRTLDTDEKKGVWALLGLLAGSWLAAGYFKADSKFEEMDNKKSVSDAASEAL